jgi:hypothetical protein
LLFNCAFNPLIYLAVLSEVLLSLEKSKKQLLTFAAEAKHDSLLQELLLNLGSCSVRSKINAEYRKEDPDWFEGPRITLFIYIVELMNVQFFFISVA